MPAAITRYVMVSNINMVRAIAKHCTGSSGAFRVMPAAITRYGTGMNVNMVRAIAKHCTDHPAHSVSGQHKQQIVRVDACAALDADLLDRGIVFRPDDGFHLHRFD